MTITPEQADRIEALNAGGIGISREAGLICELAGKIAGMCYEYSVEQSTIDNPHWHIAIPYDRGFEKNNCTQLASTFRANNPHNHYRIVRRLVGEPEMID